MKAAVEADRYEREQIRDRAEAARNAATHTYESLFGDGDAQPGDEALPRVKSGEGEPPEVVYSHGEQPFSASLFFEIVLD